MLVQLSFFIYMHTALIAHLPNKHVNVAQAG